MKVGPFCTKNKLAKKKKNKGILELNSKSSFLSDSLQEKDIAKHGGSGLDGLCAGQKNKEIVQMILLEKDITWPEVKTVHNNFSYGSV